MVSRPGIESPVDSPTYPVLNIELAGESLLCKAETDIEPEEEVASFLLYSPDIKRLAIDKRGISTIAGADGRRIECD